MNQDTHIVLAFLMSLAGSGLLIVTSVSLPIWKKIYFLRETYSPNEVYKYGIWGVCYQFNQTQTSCSASGLHLDGQFQPPHAPRYMHYLFVLFPVAAGFAVLASFFHVLTVARKRDGWVFPSGAYLSFITNAALWSTVAWVCAIVQFTIGSSKSAGVQTKLGLGVWLSLSGMVLLILATVQGFSGLVTKTKEQRAAYTRAMYGQKGYY